jgi:hypothetical protein
MTPDGKGSSLSQIQPARSTEVRSVLLDGPATFPFRRELSLAPLLNFWAQEFGNVLSPKGRFAGIVREEAEKAPELLSPITDLSVIARYRELIDVLMAAVFPPASFDQEFGAALVPFQWESFYHTPAFERLFKGEDGAIRGSVNLDPATLDTVRRLKAYALVLERVYGVELRLDYPTTLTVTDPDTGLDRHFRVELDPRFIDVEAVGPVPPLTDAARLRLRDAHMNPDLLGELVPPERFVLRGFTIFRAVEVTIREVLSSLKRDLIDKESIVSSTLFQVLQQRLRTLFRRPELRFGLAALDGDQVLVLNYGVQTEDGCIFADSRHLTTADFAGSIYERAVSQGGPLIVEDLEAVSDRTPVDDEVLQSGVRNIIVAPLHYQDKVIGTLELGSPRPGDLDASHLPLLQEVLPLFAMAVQRSMGELNSRIQAVIKEKCTAIHPVVEWRFRKAVLAGIEQHAEGGADGSLEIEPIVFERVYPLYALSDIRGSSTQRSVAIQADLLTQLRLAKDVVQAAHQARQLPALDELRYRLDKTIARIDKSLRSGDEAGVVNFLRADVERQFDTLQEFGVAVRERVAAYRAAIDPKIGTVYQRRRLFEESVTRIAEGISSYLDLEEQTAQGMFPHYFEKQKTDGVDYQIYVGGSLLEDGRFDPLYLKSMRLWQLMVTCGVARRAHQLRDQLPVPLETTHLVLVQHTPLSIRFRFDEKRFDVDGAYDIRYEIVKKRIDKAVIRGTNERATQPGKIAIVYAQAGEAQEYRAYIEYLQHLGYLAKDVEDFELEELQGVHGLRALRVAVNLDNPRVERPVPLRDLQTAAPLRTAR